MDKNFKGENNILKPSSCTFNETKIISENMDAINRINEECAELAIATFEQASMGEETHNQSVTK